jgi:hypothetical protein
LREFTGSSCEVIHGAAKMGEVFMTYLTTEKAGKGLGWEAQVPLRQA